METLRIDKLEWLLEATLKLKRHVELLNTESAVEFYKYMSKQIAEYHELQEKLEEIELFVFDYDGVFTDGIVLLMEDGSNVRQANTRDGYAVQWAVKQGMNLAILTGGKEEAVRSRMKLLGVDEVHLGCHDKLASLKELCGKLEISLDKVMYMGDDMPDLPAMKEVGLSICPNDAATDILNIGLVLLTAEKDVREILEQAMRLNGIWSSENDMWYCTP